jgi:hypothetical protein
VRALSTFRVSSLFDILTILIMRRNCDHVPLKNLILYYTLSSTVQQFKRMAVVVSLHQRLSFIQFVSDH